ncbi:hypothetical protein ALQ49_200083 [Pseudomonas syringae pv. apii]|uniref:Uncharacterized protein n=1 Tax=Pseudomonas syringae pv. apii TaxID=81036 RepID=A0A3M3S0W8_9PSED|nr:hypothetical protein ALQ49_200083 [Pseudomonas syringae pv. apii]
MCIQVKCVPTQTALFRENLSPRPKAVRRYDTGHAEFNLMTLNTCLIRPKAIG